MAKISILAGSVTQSINLFIQDSSKTTGAGLPGLAFNTANLIAYYTFSGVNTASTAISLASLGIVGAAWSTAGFKEIDSTNMIGLYRLDIPNAALAVNKGRSVVIMMSGASNMAACVAEIELTAVDNQSTGFGLVNASSNVVQINGATASAGVAQVGVNVVNINGSAASAGVAQVGVNVVNISGAQASAGVAQVGANLVNILGAVVSTPATAGILDVNIKNIANATASTGVAQVGANAVAWVGGAIPSPNITGTPKVDVVDLGGAGLSTGVAMVGVNVVKYNAQTAVTDGNNYPSVNVVDISGATASAGVAQIGANVVNISGSQASAGVAQVGANIVNISGAAASAGVAQVGTNVVNISGAAVSTGVAQVGVAVQSFNSAATNTKKNVALSKFPFVMRDSTTNAPKTGLTVTAQRSLDGAAFASCTNIPTETSNGWYYIDLSAADMNGINIAFRFSSSGAADTDIEITTIP